MAAVRSMREEETALESEPLAARRGDPAAFERRPRRTGQTLGDLLRVQDLLPSSRVDSN
jgi:hypothetical protein